MHSCPSSLDYAFGPRVDPCRRAFDFTQLFEELILAIAPSVLFFAAAAARAVSLRNARRYAAATSPRALKLLAIGCFASVQLALLLLRCLEPSGRTPATIPAAAVAVVDALVICFLSILEHSHSIRPSAVLETYLFCTLFLDATRIRTAWISPGDRTINILLTASLGTKLAVLVLETATKSASLECEHAAKSPEETSGLFGQLLLSWLIRLLNNGYRKILTLQDMLPLSADMRSEAVSIRFEDASKDLARGSHDASLARILFRALRWDILWPVIPRFALVVLTYCQPLLIDRVISLQSEPRNEDNENIGYGLIGAYGLVYVGLAILTAGYWCHVYRATTKVRGALASKIYTKVNSKSILDSDDSAAVTLMSTDVERVTLGFNLLHETWANVLEIGIGTYLLQRQLGVPAYVALGVALACAVVAVLLGSTAGRRQKAWMEAIERRISATAGFLGSMKSVKMLGISKPLGTAIQKLRLEEIQSASRYRTLQIIMITLAYVPQTASPILAFTAYTFIGRNSSTTLDVARMFTSLSILNLLASQFTALFQALPAIVSAFACLDRVEKFLSTDDQVDRRMRGSLLPSISTTNFSLGRMMADILSAEEQEFETRIKKFSRPLPSVSEKMDAVNLREASFGWTADGKPILRGLTTNIPSNGITMIVGPVASGKSTLLKGILGEVYTTSGTVWVSTGNVSYCDQTPWLRNATVQQNILGFELYDQEWYATVVRACALQGDLSQLSNGDQTVVGNSGTSLSGGQKQRVAIARAVYAQRDMAILDDVLSGMDATTARSVFNAVLGSDGLLRQRQTSILLATHSVPLLQFADHIIALGRDGTIAEQGTYRELASRRGGYVHRLCTTVEDVDDDDDDDWYIDTNPRTASRAAKPIFQRSRSQKMEPPPTDMTMNASDRQVGDKKVYWYYFQATGLLNAGLLVLAELSLVSLEYFPSVWLSLWADANDDQDANDAGYYLGVYAALQVGFLLALFLGAKHVASTMVVRSGKWLHKKLVSTVMAAPLGFFNDTDTGVTLNRFSQDMHLIDAELPISLLLFGAAAFGVVAQAVVVFVAAHYVGIALALVAIVFYFIQRYYLRTSRQLRFLDLEAKSPLYSLFLETLQGRATIRAFRWKGSFRNEFLRALDASQRPLYLLYSIQQWLTLVLGLITAAIAVALVTIMLTLENSTTTNGLGGVALVNMISLSSTLMSAVITWTKLETSIGAVSRVREFAKETPTEPVPEHFEEPPPTWPSRGAVHFEKVSASYKPEWNYVLKNISLDIRPGEKIGICGRSGSGKSTLISTLFRLIECSAGAIVIDGIDISTLPPELVRSRLNALPQDPYFAPASIRYNADPMGNASDEAISAALSRVGLEDMIVACPGGLDAHMDPDVLSHGQRQLFCIARAMLRTPRPSVVVVDEATSSVDADTDAHIQRIIRSEFGGPDCTLIVIAHRLDTIMDLDRIVVFERGEIVECGSPTALLNHPGNSVLRTLYNEFSSYTTRVS